jgi:hypothetical protein
VDEERRLAEIAARVRCEKRREKAPPVVVVDDRYSVCSRSREALFLLSVMDSLSFLSLSSSQGRCRWVGGVEENQNSLRLVLLRFPFLCGGGRSFTGQWPTTSVRIRVNRAQRQEGGFASSSRCGWLDLCRREETGLDANPNNPNGTWNLTSSSEQARAGFLVIVERFTTPNLAQLRR